MSSAIELDGAVRCTVCLRPLVLPGPQFHVRVPCDRDGCSGKIAQDPRHMGDRGENSCVAAHAGNAPIHFPTEPSGEGEKVET